MLPAASAANFVAQMQTDFLLGVVSKTYGKSLEKERLANIPLDDRAALLTDMETRRSLLAVVGECLGGVRLTSMAAVAKAAKRELSDSLPKGIFVRDAVKVLGGWGMASARHWALIQALVIKPTEASLAAGTPLHPYGIEEGTSGMGTDAVNDLRAMRQEHPKLAVLRDGLDAARVLRGFSGVGPDQSVPFLVQ